jgi:hypothetical protein
MYFTVYSAAFFIVAPRVYGCYAPPPPPTQVGHFALPNPSPSHRYTSAEFSLPTYI